MLQKIVATTLFMPRHRSLRIPLGQWFRLEVAVAECHNALYFAILGDGEKALQVVVGLLALGHILQAWAAAHMHPARSEAVCDNRELEHRSRNSAVFAPQVGLGRVAHNHDSGCGRGHKRRAVVTHLGNLVEGRAVIDDKKMGGVHIA